MKEEIKILQSQHRLKFNEEIEQWINNGEGWKLMNPIHASIFPELNRTYYIATLVRKIDE